MLRVQLRNYHGNIRFPAVCAVVGNHGNLSLCISLLELDYSRLVHIDGTENKIDLLGDRRNVGSIGDNHAAHALGHGILHLPVISDRILITLSRGTGTCGENCQIKIGVVLQQHYKALPYHTGSADYACTELLFNSKHDICLSDLSIIK